MDKLDAVFEMQSKLNQNIREGRNLNFTQSEWIQKEVLAMLSELAELLDEVNFKWWKNEKPVNAPALKEEIVDIFHFFLSMCLDAGMTAEELFQIYLDKNEENFKRQFGTSAKTGYKQGE